jgi:hypothetical protein
MTTQRTDEVSHKDSTNESKTDGNERSRVDPPL